MSDDIALGTIEEEAAACRAAWAACPDATAGAHIHHEAPFEALSEPIEARIAYILKEKPKEERALRLRLMRPVEGAALAEYERVKGPALAEYERVRGAAWAEYERVEGAALAEYGRVEGAALAEYERVTGPARAEYQRVNGAARAEYQRVLAEAHSRLCPTAGCPWDGESIFGGGR